jgi:hypothetical protein
LERTLATFKVGIHTRRTSSYVATASVIIISGERSSFI